MIGMRLARGAGARRRDPLAACSTRCCSRTPAARPTRRRWRRCSAPTTTSPSGPPSASTGRDACPRSCGRCARSRRAARCAARLDRLLAIKDEGEVTRALMQARCDRGAEIALMLGLERETAEAIRALDEHWDGGGQPRGLRGEEIPLLGPDPLPRPDGGDLPRRGRRARGVGVARRRRGRWFDPALVDALGAVRGDAAFWASLPKGDVGRLGARGPGAHGRRCAAGPDRRRLRRHRRRQVAVDLSPLRSRLRDR